ncbi:M20/M25/M40 family metallo-hydrolase [Agromyces mediolanus]|uniref:M20 family metallopeptidase n=1 Tax=Agromyces mediolanus TaxID=41986 RepID=UPI00203BE0B1|nr:M20/M25/M40 family metallo-hydrolase [Agromyces mediolanus]MCM3657641.1 M20/M25/M40 family metallo-hydrolase [Agromyces mediolanus]
MTAGETHDLDDEIVAQGEALAAFLADSVRRPSVTGAERAVADFYADWMRAHGWDVELQLLAGTRFAASEEHVDDRANVIGYPLGRPRPGDRTIVLNGHLDVVPEGELTGWTHPPFDGVREGGRVHGRGTVDMKGGIAAALVALDVLRERAEPLSHVPVVHLVIGEERTGVGTRLALTLTGPPTAAIVLEPTGNALVTACTGLQFFRVEAAGIAAHSSAPWLGVDALARLLVLRDAFIATAAARSAEFAHHRFADVPTGIPFNIGLLEAGEYQASVPERARMTGRIGLKPGEDPEAARAAFADALAAVVRDDPHERERPHRLEWLGAPYPGWETLESGELVRAFVQGLELVDGDAELRGFTAGNDAGQYAALGVPTVVFGPGDTALAHTADESVTEAELLRAARTIANALRVLP